MTKLVVLAVMLLLVVARPRAASAAPFATATASPTPVPATDACGGPGRLLATVDRPTVSYSACAVPIGSVVLEAGYQSTVQRGQSPSIAIVYPQGFERVGVAERLELDLVGPNENRTTTPTGRTGGASDFGLGFKYELPQRGRFTYALDGLYAAATGTGGFSAGGPSETLNVVATYALSPAIGLGTTLAGMSSAGTYALVPAMRPGPTSNSSSPSGTNALGQQRFGAFVPSIVVTAQIPQYYQFYAEFADQTKLGPAQGGRALTNFGLQKLVGPNLVLDVEYGASFTPVDGSRFSYVGAGAGIRIK